MTKHFNNLYSNIINEDIEKKSPHPNIYKLFKTDKGLWKRVYFAQKSPKSKTFFDEKIIYSLDKSGHIPHNLDGPAYIATNNAYIIANKGSSIFQYYINGVHISKKEWEIARHLNNLADLNDVKNIVDI